jgi:hypothetical protein
MEPPNPPGCRLNRSKTKVQDVFRLERNAVLQWVSCSAVIEAVQKHKIKELLMLHHIVSKILNRKLLKNIASHLQSLESLSKNLCLSSKKKGTKCDFQNELYTFDTKSLAFLNNNFDSRVKVALAEDMKRPGLNVSPIVKSLELCLFMLGNQVAKAEEDTKGMAESTEIFDFAILK